MPTKKRRVGFIPRSEVMNLINKLSYETNLSYSKIINILVEEALYKRGMLNEFNENKNDLVNKDIRSKLNIEIMNNEFKYKIKNNLLKDENPNLKEVNEETFDNEIYAKFLMFLQFKERMKKEFQ